MFQSTKAVKTIFYMNVIAFFLTLILPSFIYLNFAMFDYNSSNLFEPWQIVTYQFLHSGVMHILFNMLVLLSFGPSIEEIYGEKRFWIYYLLCGVSSALFHSYMVNSGDIPLVGASGSIWGLMVLYTLLYPNDKMYLFFIPIGVKAKYLILALFIVEVFSGVLLRDGVSHFGHVGGALMGAIIYFLNKIK